MTDAAQDLLQRLKMAQYPVPAPAHPGLLELLYLGFVKDSEAPAPYPSDYRVWALTDAGRCHG